MIRTAQFSDTIVYLVRFHPRESIGDWVESSSYRAYKVRSMGW